MRSSTNGTARDRLVRSMPGLLLAILLLSAGTATAQTDYMFFSVNGDTTLSAMVQGDTLGWGANCDTGATLYWEIWYDVNADAMIDDADDKMMVSFYSTDGDTASDGPEADISPIPDGWYESFPFILGVGEGQYIFKVLNLTDSSTVERTLGSTAMASPPNVFRGQITVPGHPAPDSAVLLNVAVEAEPMGDEPQAWIYWTNDSGFFEINISSVGTGQSFWISPGDIPGFVTPEGVELTASGLVDNVDFTYMVATDSVFGYLKDEQDSVIMTPAWVYANPAFSGPSEKEAQTQNGMYTFYFAPSEYGEWYLSFSSDNLVPTYLIPEGISINVFSSPGIQEDFVLLESDTTLYVRVTENGGEPVNNYRIGARSSGLGVFTDAVSGTGSDNVATLHISSHDMSGWEVYIDVWDWQYPVPDGFILEGGPFTNVAPGDTVEFNFVSGIMVSDTVFQDPEDAPIDFSEVWVSLFREPDYYAEGQVGNDGVYTVWVDTGSFYISAFLDGYLTYPMYRTVDVTGDTTGGLSFTINEAHCRVSGTLTDIPLPLASEVWVMATTGVEPDGYGSSALVDSTTGEYTLFLCDGDWTINPPMIDDRVAPDPIAVTIGESPDTARTIDLNYSVISSVDDPATGGLPVEYSLGQNYPNPFNPTTEISFSLPVSGRVELSVYNVLGQSVVTLIDGMMSAGHHTVRWNGEDASGKPAATGVYFYRLSTDDFVDTRKMLMLK